LPLNPPRSSDPPSRRQNEVPAHRDPAHHEQRALSATARGTVTVICGCMFSGKTSELLRRLEMYPRRTTLAFKHALDTRYSATAIVSHAGKASPAIVVKNSAEIERHITEVIDMVAIDEAHFFDEGSVDVVARIVERGIGIVLTSLQPDSWGRPFPVADQLLAIADEPILSSATCARCGAVADRTQRLTPIIDGRMVVEPDNYEPRCVKCWRPPPEPPM